MADLRPGTVAESGRRAVGFASCSDLQAKPGAADGIGGSRFDSLGQRRDSDG